MAEMCGPGKVENFSDFLAGGDFNPKPLVDEIRNEAYDAMRNRASSATVGKLDNTINQLQALYQTDPGIVNSVLAELTKPDSSRRMPVANIVMNLHGITSIEFTPGCLDLSKHSPLRATPKNPVLD
jgi:hypothetical protein